MQRVNRLIKQLKHIAPRLLTLFYKDGTQRTVDDPEALEEIMSGQVVDFRYHNEEDGADGFYAALMAGCHDIHELWADGDDSGMLEGKHEAN